MKNWIKRFVFVLTFVTTTLFAQAPLQQTPLIPKAPDIDAKAYLLMDVMSGKILAAKNIDAKMPPASLTKLMTMYVLSSALKQGTLHLDDKVRISTAAWKTGGSRMFVKAGDEVSIEDLLQGIIVDSGNDATVAIAEHMAGSQDAFAALMNQEAERLGMTNTHYTNPTGLPNPNHYSTARDLATLAEAIIRDFPEDYTWYSKKRFTYAGIKQTNRNRLLWRDKTVDGLKTGHTDAAGYCLVASALKDNMRLISVVLGAPTDTARTEDSEKLLNYGFRFYKTNKVFDAGETLAIKRVYYGKQKTIPLGTTETPYITLPKGEFDQLTKTISIDTPLLTAPIQKGQALGKYTLSFKGKPEVEIPLVALHDDPKGGLWTRMTDYISFKWHQWV